MMIGVAPPPTILLLHSPFLGPSSLRPLADELAARGRSTVLLDLRMTVAAPPVHARLIGGFADAVGDSGLAEPLVLAGHSGAGPLLPAFADALDDPVAALLFVDAGLPTPGRSWRDTVPPELYRQLRDQSRDGLLPSWHNWFDRELLTSLVPDDELRHKITDEAQEVPLAFLKEERPSVEWAGPAGYLALSDAYPHDVAAARERGWPVRELALHHLAPATHPGPVATELLALLTALDA
jgi:pimeloyl-ACP methyl ester carboxylesterase